jgi:uncharacterized membrane-anchored protein YhcB (DUF1043 family)
MSEPCRQCEDYEAKIDELESELQDQQNLRMQAEQERDDLEAQWENVQNGLDFAEETIKTLKRDYKTVLEHNKELEHRLSLYQEDGKRWLDVGR